MADLNEVREEATRLMRQHGLLPVWSFRFDRSLRRFGCCQYRHHRITLSQHLCLLNPLLEIRETILHEIAHALVGPNVGHGPQWIAQAKAIGCRARRCYHDGVSVPQGRYVAECNNCHAKSYAHRRIRREVACRQCCSAYNGGKYDPRFRLIFLLNVAPKIYTIWSPDGKPLTNSKTGKIRKFSSLEEANRIVTMAKARGAEVYIREGEK